MIVILTNFYRFQRDQKPAPRRRGSRYALFVLISPMATISESTRARVVRWVATNPRDILRQSIVSLTFRGFVGKGGVGRIRSGGVGWGRVGRVGRVVYMVGRVG